MAKQMTAAQANGKSVSVKSVSFIPHEGKEATKNCFRFSEVPEGGQPPVIGELYVQKWALGGKQPAKLTVAVTIG